MSAVEGQLPQCLSGMHKWATEDGFVFSSAKARWLHFCKLGKLHNDTCLKLGGAEVPVLEQHEFLGIVFDKKIDICSPSKMFEGKM